MVAVAITRPSLLLAGRLSGPRLDLEPLRVEHAREMAALLDDPGLHAFIGGQPASLRELQERYRRQVTGSSPDGLQRWLNWVLRRREGRTGRRHGAGHGRRGA